MATLAITAGTNLLYSPTKVHERQSEQEGPLEKEGVISSTRMLVVQEPSLLRRISVLFWTLIHDMWVSLSSTIGAHLPFCLRVRIKNKDTKEVDSEVDRINNLRDSAINSTMQSLRTQTPFTNIGVDQYCTFLAETYFAQYIPNCLLGDGDINNFPQRMQPTVFIPIVLKERFRDHIVALFITHDPAANRATIELYDSKGLTIADRMDEPIANNPNMTLGQLIAQLSDRYAADKLNVIVKENTTKHQWDSHNCGIYVCRYFDMRLFLDARDLDARGLDQIIGYTNTSIWRTQMIEDLMPTFQDASDQAEEMQRIPASAFDMPEDVDEVLDSSSLKPEQDPIVFIPLTDVFEDVLQRTSASYDMLEGDDEALNNPFSSLSPSTELEKNPIAVIPEDFVDIPLD